MGSLNKVFLLGNLTREPELRYTPGGSAVGEFGLAVNRKFNDKEETCFVDIVVWGKQAETCNRFLEKGVSVLIEGRLQLDQWQDKESGARRSRLRVVAERVQFLGRGERGPDGSYPPDEVSEYDGGYQQEAGPAQNYAPPPRQQSGGYRQQGATNDGGRQGGYRQAPPQDGQYGGGYQPQQRQQQHYAAPQSQQPPPQSQPQQRPQQQQPPPPPMPPEGAFDVEGAEDDIPF